MSEQILDEIQHLIDEEAHESALILIEEHEESFQEDSFFFYLKGYTLFRLQRFEEALESYKKSISLDFENCAAYSDIGYVLLVMERWDEAEFFIKKALQMNPSDPLGIERLGLLYYSIGEFEQARDCFLTLIQLGHENSRIFFFLGELHAHLGEFQASMDYLDSCLEIDELHLDALFSKASLLEELGRLEDAVELFEKVLSSVEEEDEMLDVLVSLGSCYYKLGDLKKAFEIFKRAMLLDDSHALILNNMGLICLELNYMEAAETYLSRSLKVMENFEAWFNLGRCHLKCERYRLALSAFRKALGMDPGREERSYCYYHLGQVQKSLELYSQACESFETSVSLGASLVDQYLQYLECCLQLYRLEEGYEFLHKSKVKELEYYHALFLFTVSRGELERALRFVKLGLRKYKDMPALNYYKASVLAMQGKAKAAIKALKAAVDKEARFKTMAKKNACFSSLLEDPEFLELVKI